MRRKSSPIREWTPSDSSSGRRSYGIDCQTLSDSPWPAAMRWKIPGAPSHPSLSWIAVTPRRRSEPQPLARRFHKLVLRHRSEPRAELPRGFLPQDPGRLSLFVPLDDAAFDVEVTAGSRERGGVEPQRVVVLREERGGRLSCHFVEGFLRGLDVPLGRAPAGAANPASLSGMRPDALERLRERRHALEPHVALRERPGREVDVRVREPRDDAAPAEVDDVGRRQRGLVDADAAGDARSRDRERARDGQRLVHRAHDAVIQDHGADSSRRPEEAR